MSHKPVAGKGGGRGRGVMTNHPNLPKGPFLVTKWAKNNDEGEAQNSSFWVLHFFGGGGVSISPKSIAASSLIDVHSIMVKFLRKRTKNNLR